MSYKTVLCHFCDAEAYKPQIDVAIGLASSQGAHLVGLYVVEPLALPVDPIGALPAEFYERYEAEAEAQANAIRDAFLNAAKRNGLSAQWRLERGYRKDTVKAQAAYADLLIVGHTTGLWSKDGADSFAADMAITSGRPVLYVPGGPAPAQVGRRILLAWNGSREAARAAADALPLLKASESTMVVSARQSPSEAMDMGAVLARHDVPVTTQNIEAAADTRIGEMLLREADRRRCDVLVMGVYGHGRMNEWVFGGVTRYILSHATIPLLLAH